MSQHLLLKSFTVAGGQVHELGTVNVFVGANNSGKSEVLRDIARLAGHFEPTGDEGTGGAEPKTRVINDVTFVGKLSMDRLLRGLTTFDTGTEEGKIVQGLAPDLRSPYRRTIAADLKNILFRPIITARSVWMTSLGDLMPLRVAYLPANQRAQLIQPAPPTSPLRAPEHALAALQHADPLVLEKLDQAIATIFPGNHVCLDSTDRVQLALRIAASVPPVTGNAVADAQAMGRLKLLQQEGDGIVHCAATVLAVLLSRGRVILLDQPDEGLQPDTSRRLGAWIGENAAELGCQVFVATRDPAFLSGLFAGSNDVSIWRLVRKDSTTRFENVPAECGRAFATFPLFTSQQALGCLFREGVIVTPNSVDTVIYQAVAERLLRVHNIGFLHAHGVRNLTFVVKALKRANLPVCVVAELDCLQNEASFTELIKAVSNNPPPTPWSATRERLVSHVEGWFNAQELSATTSEVESFLDQFKRGEESTEVAAPPPPPRQVNTKAKWDRLRQERLTILPPELRIWVEELLADLKRIGLFVSPKGKLEGWIGFAADADDPDGWLNRAMQVIHAGDCPADLRAFVAEMAAFITASVPTPRPARSGNGT